MINTSIEFPYMIPEELGYLERCVFNFEILVENENGEVYANRCIKIHPSW